MAKTKVAVEVSAQAQSAIQQLEQLRIALNRISKSSGGMGNGVDQMSSSMSGLAAAGKALIAIGVAKSMYDLGKSAITTYAQLEQTTVALETMIGSSKKTKALLADIRKLDAGSPYTSKDFLDASKYLLQYGMDVEEVIPTLKNLGDIGAGDAEQMKHLALAYSQCMAAGRLMGQDLNQMINSGFNPLKSIADKTGKSMGVLKKEMEEGRIPFSMVKQAFSDATKEGGDFYKMMERQSKTLAGQWSTLKSNAEQAAASIGEQLAPALKDLLKVFNDSVTDTDGTITRWQKLGALLSSFVDTALELKYGFTTARIEVERFFASFGKQDEATIAKRMKLTEEEIKAENDFAPVKKRLEIWNKQGSEALAKYNLENKETTEKDKKKKTNNYAPPPSGADHGAAFLKQWMSRGQSDWSAVDVKYEQNIEELVKQSASSIEVKKKEGVILKAMQQEQHDQKVALAEKYSLAVLGSTQKLVGQLSGLYQQDADNKIARDQRKYDMWRYYINNTVTDEKTKAAALYNVQVMQDAKERSIKRQAAQQNKKLSIAQATISGIQAAIESYKALAGIPGVGPVLGGLAAAAATYFTTLQIRMIQDTPLPMAEGGMIKSRMGGTHVLAAEGGEDEYYLPRQSAVPQLADEIVNRMGGNRPTYIVLDGQILGQFTDNYRQSRSKLMGAGNYQTANVYI